MTAGTGVVLAHQGGWDELLFVLVPILLFAGLLAVANRRASRLGLGEQGEDGRDPGAADDAPDPPTGPG
ncbi:MAG TPA: hypothetical protein VFV32_12530 [Acidimicrobiales bacterium]|nr:hypothetical protein [Acidimicrobiales bacterium]